MLRASLHRILLALAALMLCLSAASAALCASAPTRAWAAGQPTVTASGLMQGSQTVRWTLYSDGLLSITGSGAVDSPSMWSKYASQIKNITMEPTVKPLQMNAWFLDAISITSLDARNWNLSQCRSMNQTFSGCTSLTSLDARGWDTSSLTDISYLFSDCASLRTAYVDDWNTSNIVLAPYVFMNCYALETVDVSKWDMSKVTSIKSFFREARTLKTVDISAWNVSNVNQMGLLFWKCASLESVDVSKWDTANAGNIGNMFSFCSKLNNVDVSKWNTAKVYNAGSIFEGCTSLESLDLSSWSMAAVKKQSNMFTDCTSLRQIKLGAGWSFKTIDANATEYSVLPTPSAISPYTGFWQEVGAGGPSRPTGRAYSAEALRDGYDGATMSGTYVWGMIPQLPGTLNVAGEALVSKTLQAALDPTPIDATIEYTWYRSESAGAEGTPVGTGANRLLVEADYGKYLYATARDTSESYLGTLKSTPKLISATLSVTVPSDVHFKAKADGTLSWAGNAALINGSAIAVHISGMQAKSASPATLHLSTQATQASDSVALRTGRAGGTLLELASYTQPAAPTPTSEWAMGKLGDADSTLPLQFNGHIDSFSALDPALDKHFATITWTVSAGRG